MNGTKSSSGAALNRAIATAFVIVLLAPAVSFAAGKAPVRKQVRKVHYVLATGSWIPVPSDRVSGGIATTAESQQIIHVRR